MSIAGLCHYCLYTCPRITAHTWLCDILPPLAPGAIDRWRAGVISRYLPKAHLPATRGPLSNRFQVALWYQVSLYVSLPGIYYMGVFHGQKSKLFTGLLQLFCSFLVAFAKTCSVQSTRGPCLQSTVTFFVFPGTYQRPTL